MSEFGCRRTLKLDRRQAQNLAQRLKESFLPASLKESCTVIKTSGRYLFGTYLPFQSYPRFLIKRSLPAISASPGRGEGISDCWLLGRLGYIPLWVGHQQSPRGWPAASLIASLLPGIRAIWLNRLEYTRFCHLSTQVKQSKHLYDIQLTQVVKIKLRPLRASHPDGVKILI